MDSKPDYDLSKGSCRICGGDLKELWRLPVMNGRFEGRYAECQSCHSLQVVNPIWLDEAYATEGLEQDSGRMRRNFSAFLYITALEAAGVLPANPCYLDFGSGSGILTQLLRDTGRNAWQNDLFRKPLLFSQDRFIEDLHVDHGALKDGVSWPSEFGVITALEVVEHLENPIPLLQGLASRLTSDGVMLLSTALYRSGEHDISWPYLSSQGGQHITFWSEAALHVLKEKLNFNSVGYFPESAGFLIVLSRLSEAALLDRLYAAHQCLQNAGHIIPAVLPLDFRADGAVSNHYGIYSAASSPLL